MERTQSVQETIRRICVHFIPLVLSLLCYINGFHGAFVHDDVMAILTNRDVTGQNELSGIFYHDFWGDPMRSDASHKSYRPICVMSFRLDYNLSGGNPKWFHAVNIGLHMMVVFLITRVCLLALRMSMTSTVVATSLFAVHPVHSEAVTGIVGRADVLSAAFFLLSFYSYVRCLDLCQDTGRDVNDNITPKRTNKMLSCKYWPVAYWVWSIVFALAGMLTKETGVTVLAVNIAYDTLVHWKYLSLGNMTYKTRYYMKRILITLLTTVSILSIRMAIMNFEKPTFQYEDNPASFSSSLVTRMLSLNYIACYNFWLMLCPWLLSYDWTGGSVTLIESLSDPRNMFTISVYALLVTATWTSLHQVYKLNERTIAMSLLLMVLPFLPASNLFFRVGFVIAERILYIPSIGFCLLVAHGMRSLCMLLPKRRAVLSLLFFALLIVMSTRTYQRNKVWESRSSLFRSGVKEHPENAKVHYNLGNFLKDVGNTTGAELHYREAIRLNPYNPSYHTNLGTVLKNLTEAKECYLEALRISPDHKNSLMNLGSLLLDEGSDVGVTYVQRSLNLDPNFLEALLVMGNMYLVSKNFSEAERYFKKALTINPHRSDVHLSLGNYFHMTNNLEAALKEYHEVLNLQPQDVTVYKNMAAVYSDTGNYSEALRLLQVALVDKPDCDECLSALGSVYMKTGQFNQAVMSLSKSIELSPNKSKSLLRYVRALKENNQGDEAKLFLEQTVKNLPQDFLVIWFAYNFSMEQNNIKDATVYIGQAITLAEKIKQPLLDYLYKEQADLFRIKGELDNAIKFYEMSLSINEAYEDSLVNLGSVYYLKKNYEQAERHYIKALTVNPLNEIAKINLEKLRKNQEKFKRHDMKP